LTVALHDDGNQNAFNVFSVYVVVIVGVTEILLLLRFGYTKFNPIIFGVMVARVVLVYDAFKRAVCPGIIAAVGPVSVQLEGIFSAT
jgi:hypothetical protein